MSGAETERRVRAGDEDPGATMRSEVASACRWLRLGGYDHVPREPEFLVVDPRGRRALQQEHEPTEWFANITGPDGDPAMVHGLRLVVVPWCLWPRAPLDRDHWEVRGHVGVCSPVVLWTERAFQRVATSEALGERGPVTVWRSVPPEPPVGSRRDDGARKVRHIGPAAWEAALSDAITACRRDGTVTAEHLAAMGYESDVRGVAS